MNQNSIPQSTLTYILVGHRDVGRHRRRFRGMLLRRNGPEACVDDDDDKLTLDSV
jgi:hypothetical protein